MTRRTGTWHCEACEAGRQAFTVCSACIAACTAWACIACWELSSDCRSSTIGPGAGRAALGGGGTAGSGVPDTTRQSSAAEDCKGTEGRVAGACGCGSPWCATGSEVPPLPPLPPEPPLPEPPLPWPAARRSRTAEQPLPLPPLPCAPLPLPPLPCAPLPLSSPLPLSPPLPWRLPPLVPAWLLPLMPRPLPLGSAGGGACGGRLLTPLPFPLPLPRPLPLLGRWCGRPGPPCWPLLPEHQEATEAA